MVRLKTLLSLLVTSAVVSGCITPEQVAGMSDIQVCQGAVAWPDGGTPQYVNGGNSGLFVDEAVGRGLTVSSCAPLLLAALRYVPDQSICDRAVSWLDVDQVPYWTNTAGIYRYVAHSRGFRPIDCHDSNFECLDNGFERGTDTFKQCRLQLIIARREAVQVQKAIDAAAAAEARRLEYLHQEYEQQHTGPHDDDESRNRRYTPEKNGQLTRVPSRSLVRAAPSPRTTLPPIRSPIIKAALEAARKAKTPPR